MTKTTKKTSAFGNLGDMMGMEGMTSVLSAVSDAGRPSFAVVGRSEIKIYEQQRDKNEMESEEQTLAELAADMRVKGILQPIILCEDEQGPEPWRLVAGERRYHGSGLAEIDELPAMCYGKLTEQQIKDIQLAENIHRLNLSQLNEARVLQSRLDDEFLGDVGALCEAISKSRSWVSKRLGLLDMPEQTQRLVKEGVTADIEVINQVKTIEKIDPEAAREAVDTLKAEKGEKGANARKTVKAAKDKVKPPKAKPGKAAATEEASYAQPRDTSHEEHGPVESVPPATLESDPALIELQQAIATDQEQSQLEQAQVSDEEQIDWLDGQPASSPVGEPSAPAEQPDAFGHDLDGKKVLGVEPTALLDQAFSQIRGGTDKAATEFVESLSRPDRNQIEDWLCAYYEAGVACENLALAVMQGLNSGSFSSQGHSAFALAAFLSGGEDGVLFNLVNVLGCVK